MSLNSILQHNKSIKNYKDIMYVQVVCKNYFEC